MKSPSSIEPRVVRSLVQLFVLLTAGIGSASLLGWFLQIPLLASFGPDLIPMAPSTALCFVMLGVAMFFRVRWPGNRHAYLSSIFISSMILLSSLLLFLLSSIGAQSQIEHLGLSVPGSFGGVSLGHMSPVTAICFAASALSSLLTVSSSIEHHKRAAAAVVFALLVFFSSSVLLVAYFIGSPVMYGGSIIPPSFPTSLAFFLLSLGLIETSGRLIWENSKTQIAATSKTSAAFSMVFILLAAGILTGGLFIYKSFEQSYRKELENQLASIAELKEGQLVQWRKERLGDGQILCKNREFTALVKQYIHNLKDRESKTRILDWISQVQAVYGYDFMMLLDGQFNMRLVMPENKERIRIVIDQRDIEKMMLGEISFQDFYRNEQDQRAYLKVLVPILDDRSPNRLIAVLALRIDPEQYLYPFIQRWPTASKSAETLLMRRDGNDALYLNELRHQSGAALTLRIPLNKVEVPAVRAALGQTGLMQGADYRGVPVIAFVRAVQGSPWSLVAKIDVAEAFAPLRERLWLMIVLICALLLASGSAVGFVWRHQRSRFYKEQYESAEALISSELRYRRLFESAKDGILILDPETGMVVDANPFLAQILDFPVEALLGRKIWELGFFKDIVANQDKFLELQEEGYVRYDDLPMETADGRRIDVEFVSNVYEAGHSKVIQCNIRDITERKRAEIAKTHADEALRESERKFRTLFENMTEGVALHEMMYDGDKAVDYRILDINPAYERHTGLAQDRARGLLASELYGTGTPPYFVEFSRVAFTGEPLTFETYFPPLNRHFKISVISPKPGSFATVFEDVSEIKRREQELSDKNAELERFTYTVSHDLKSPLITIKGFAGTILRDISNGRQDRMEGDLRRISDAADKMGGLLEDLLELSRIGRVAHPSSNVSMDEVVRDVIALLAGKIGEREATITVMPGLPVVRADRRRLFQVVQNLIENALKFMGTQPRPVVEVGMRGNDAERVFFVRDNGIGIEARYRETVFGLFDKLDTTTEGTGIGLALVRRIVEVHGGKAWVESEGKDRGSTFCFTLSAISSNQEEKKQ